MHTETNDGELIAAFAVDPPAFEAFYRRHVARVIGFGD